MKKDDRIFMINVSMNAKHHMGLNYKVYNVTFVQIELYLFKTRLYFLKSMFKIQLK